MAEKTYRINVAAQMSGLTVELIRAWERRYGLLKPRRTPGGFRVYTQADIALLTEIRRLLDDGMAISEAAKLAGGLRKQIEARSVAPEPAGDVAPLEAWRTRILQAAEAMDQLAIDRVLDEALAALPPLEVCDRLLIPVEVEIGERWHQHQLTVAQEHAVTQTVRARLVSLLHGAPRGDRKSVVLACFPDEIHELGLLCAALHFRYAHAKVTFLGQRTPVAHMVAAARELEADVLGVSAVMDVGEAGLRAVLGELRRELPRSTALLAGGACAARHAKACEGAGARVFRDAGDWPRLLG